MKPARLDAGDLSIFDPAQDDQSSTARRNAARVREQRGDGRENRIPASDSREWCGQSPSNRDRKSLVSLQFTGTPEPEGIFHDAQADFAAEHISDSG